MNRVIWMLLAVAWSVSARAEEAVPTAVAEGEAVAPAPVEAVAETVVSAGLLPPALVAFGDVDEHLVQRSHAWAKENLAIPVDLMPAQPTTQVGSLDEVAQLAASIMETNRVGIVVLWRPNSGVSNHGAYYPDSRVAVVNLNPMLTPETDAEKIERRVERQVIRGICMVFGLEPSPNPHSAMFEYANLEELDAIGRNLDPPWLRRLQDRALSVGIPVDPDSIYNMVQ